MPPLTPQYIPAMNALNEFYEMLYRAMELALHKATLSLTGSFGWRGYRIDHYKNLARSQYYCQIYPGNPHLLKFQECYHLDNGDYYYPFVCIFDLQLNNFFSKSMDSQLNLLESFVSNASESAVAWQTSEERKQKVHASFLDGTYPQYHLRKPARRFEQVPEVFLQAFPMQNKIFSLLLPLIRIGFESRFSRTVDLRPNDSWFNFDFRGYRTKVNNSDGTTPEGPSDYVWRIYFDAPYMLRFEKYCEDGCQAIDSFWLEPNFLSGNEEWQIERLGSFVNHAVAALPDLP